MTGDGRLAVDVGARRVGLAISDASCTLARPLETIAVTSEADAVERVARRIARARRRRRRARHDRGRDADAPRRHAVAADLARGRVHRAAKTRTALTDRHRRRAASSREAESRLAVHERDWRKRKKKLDAAAAAVILQDYLERTRRRPIESNDERCRSWFAVRGRSDHMKKLLGVLLLVLSRRGAAASCTCASTSRTAATRARNSSSRSRRAPAASAIGDRLVAAGVIRDRSTFRPRCG